MKIRVSLRFLTLTGILIAALLLPAAPFTAPVKAQESIRVSNVRVDIWPEYDQPTALIIYNISLDSSVKLPANLLLRIPAAAGKPHAVAWQSPDKALYELNYTTTAGSEWITISFSTPAPDIRIEYYDPSLKIDGTQRNFTFRWPGDYDVENLTLQIQQPVNATQMTFRPDAGSGQQAEDGLTYYNVIAGKVPAGTTFDLAMNYTKSDDVLTNPAQFQPATPNEPINASTSGRVMFDQFLPWILGGVGLLLILIGLLWYWRTSKVVPGVPAGRSRHSAVKPVSGRRNPAAVKSAAGGKTATAAESSGSEAPAFCSSCGKKVNPGDLFCRACGSKLK